MKMQRPRSVFRSVVLTCATALGLGAWAADPTAEWYGDFPESAAGSAAVTSEKGGLTITKNNAGNTSTADYMMVKESQGWPMLVSGLNTSTLSVVVGYQIASDIEGTIIAPSRGSNPDDCRFRYNTVGGNLKAGYVGNDSWAGLGKAQPTDGAIHYAVMTYSNNDGSSFYYDGVKLQDATGLKESSGAAFTEIDLGAIRGPNNIINGIKFYYVAVYSGLKLSDNEARAAYERAYNALPSEKVQASASGTAFNMGDYAAKNVTVTGDADGYLNVSGTANIGILTTAGEPFTAKLAAGTALSATTIDASAAAMTVDVSQYDWATLAANAVDGVPYYVWPVLSSSVSGTVEISGVNLPFGCTYETVTVAGYGIAVKILSPYKAGSLSINFAGGESGQVATVDAYKNIMHGAHPVVGTSWNEVKAANGTYNAGTYINSDGEVKTDGSATVELLQVKNDWGHGDNSCDRILISYCDDGNSPIVTINNVPFGKYRVIAYAATDNDSKQFCPRTINGVVYSTVAAGNTQTPTIAGRSNFWGRAGMRSPLMEGVSYLVSDVISDTTTVTINNPRTGDGRSCIAAVQIVEVVGPKVDEVVIEDGGTYAFNPADIKGSYVKLSCEGSFTLAGKDGYAVSEEDFGKYIDITSVTGTITFGAGASVAFGASDALDANKFAFGAGSSVRLPYTLTANYEFADGAIVYLTGDTENTGSLAATFKEGVNPAALGVTVIRKDGGYCAATWNGEGAFTYNEEINTDICGSSTVFDLSFKNTTDYAHKQSGMGCNCDVNPATYNNDFADKTTGLYLKHRPYTSGNFLTADLSAAMTVVVVGQLPSASTTFFLSLGSCNNDNKGLIFATTDVENELLVAWNSGSTMSPITTMSVPNGTLSRHVYAVTKQDDGNKSNFTVYLDGTPWKTLSIDKIDITTGGVQVGADFGGAIRNNNTTINGKTMVFKTVAAADTGVVNAIRVFGSVLDDETIKAFSAPEEYPYASPFGDSSRTFTADGSWVETESTPWTVKPNGGAEAQSGSAIDGSSLTIVSSAEDGVTVSVNLEADKTYEALMIDGDPITFEFAEGKSGVIRATGAITIAAETTIKAGALAVGGATKILDNGKAKLVFDYSGYDASVVTVANPQTTPLVLASMDEQAEGIVTCIVPTTPYRTYSFGYANGGYNLSITANKAELTIPAIENLTATVTAGGQTFEGVAGENGVTYQVPAGETVTVEYASSLEGYVVIGTAKYEVAMTGEPQTLTDVTAAAAEGVAKLGGTNYASLEAAISAANNAQGNYTITLVKSIEIGEGGISINCGRNRNITIVHEEGVKIIGTGAIAKEGSATLALKGDMTEYTGIITVNAGTLFVDGGITMNPQQVIVNGGEFKVGAATVNMVNDFENGMDFTLNGTLTMQDGSFLTVGKAPYESAKWLIASANSTINLNGGELAVCRIVKWANVGAATINFNGGTLKSYGAGNSKESIISAEENSPWTLNVLAGGAVVDADIDTTIGGVMVSGVTEGTDGGLVKKGTGKLTLAGTPTFTGAVSVEDGALYVPAGTTLNLDEETENVASDVEGFDKYMHKKQGLDVGESEIVEAADAETAKAAVDLAITVPDGVAAAMSAAGAEIGGDTYAGYFEKAAVDNGDGTFTVSPELSPAVVFAATEQETATDAQAILDAVLDDDATGAMLKSAKPGLYYSLEGSATVGFEAPVEGERTLATSPEVPVAKPEISGGTAFYRVKVSATPAASTND